MIKITRHQGKPIWINKNYIVEVTESANGPKSHILLHNGRYYYADETVEEILSYYPEERP